MEKENKETKKKYSYLTTDSFSQWIFVSQSTDWLKEKLPGEVFSGTVSAFVSSNGDRVSFNAYLVSPKD